MGFGELQPVATQSGRRSQEQSSDRGRLAVFSPGAEQQRSLGVESLLRLGISQPAQSAVVLRAGSGTGNLATGAGSQTNRRRALWGSGRARFPELLAFHR